MSDRMRLLGVCPVNVQAAFRERLAVGMEPQAVWAGLEDAEWHLQAESPDHGEVVHLSYRGGRVTFERDAGIAARSHHVHTEIDGLAFLFGGEFDFDVHPDAGDHPAPFRDHEPREHGDQGRPAEVVRLDVTRERGDVDLHAADGSTGGAA